MLSFWVDISFLEVMHFKINYRYTIIDALSRCSFIVIFVIRLKSLIIHCEKLLFFIFDHSNFSLKFSLLGECIESNSGPRILHFSFSIKKFS